MAKTPKKWTIEENARYWEKRATRRLTEAEKQGEVHETWLGAGYSKQDHSWIVVLTIDKAQVANENGVGFNRLIADLSNRLVSPAKGTPEYEDLLESVESSIAEDFRLYESLWD